MGLKVGEKIRRKRKEKGMTLKELAGEKVTASQISAVEKGKCNPSIGLIEYISERLEVDIEYFTLTDEERYRRKFNEVEKEIRSLLEEGEKAYEYVSQVEEILPYISDEQRGFYNLIKGDNALAKGIYDNAFKYYLESYIYYLKSRDTLSAAKSYIKIGDCLYSTKKYDIALGYYLTVYNSRNKDCSIYMYCGCQCALCYIFLNKFDKIIDFMNDIKSYFNNHNWEDKDTFSPTLDLIEGLIYRKENKYEFSIRKLKDSFEKYKKTNNTTCMGIAKNYEAFCFRDIEDYENAINCFIESIKYKSINKDNSLVDTYLNLADIYRKLEDEDKYLDTINKAEESVLQINYIPGIIRIFIEKFEFFSETGEFDKAEICAFIALDYIQKSGDDILEYNLYMKMSQMYGKMGDYKNLIDYISKAKILNV